MVHDLRESQTPAIDLQVLDDLKEQVGDDDGEMLNELIGSYLADGAEQIARLTSAAREQDAATVLTTAHSLRSSSALMGADPLVALLRQAEDLARTSPSELPRIDAPVQAEFARVLQSLNDVREGRTAITMMAGA